MRKPNKSCMKADPEYLTRFMGSLFPDQKRLGEIQAVYDNLTLLGQLLGAGTDITSMRQDFQELASVLLDQLAREHYKKAKLNLSSCARVAIDILVRNLFERTADIGFLATDNEIRTFAESVAADPMAARDEERLARLHSHFSEYVAKYSVYHNIMLLSPSGDVLAQLDPSNTVKQTSDRLLNEALTTSQGYVEIFRPTDLLPDEPSPLIYAYRVMADDGSRPVGVLCLCFRFMDECQRIFDSLVSEDDWTVITLLDPSGHVIASSDPYQFPLGARVEPVPDNECRIVRFAGREYLATTRQADPYQGYCGPGWLGHVMAPLNHAFEMAEASELSGVPDTILAGVLDVATLLGTALRDIPVRATTIQQELNRAVWNANIWLARESNAHNSEFAKVLLREIGSTGVRTRNVFSESTNNLYKTVVSSVLFDCGAQAALAIDIMDRNLYERANDCRWWALSRVFREGLDGSQTQTPALRQKLTTVLRHINDLYTVYSNLILFDNSGRVVAVSNAAYNDRLGSVLGEAWVRPCLGLRDTQSYCVSDFSPSSLYADQATYVFAAAVRSVENDNPVGGIAIVFDSTSQFQAMLKDALPRQEDGTPVPNAFAVFADGDGRIIASTNPALPANGFIDVSDEFLTLQRGETTANIIAYDDIYYAVGSCKSAGYREYKSASDSYQKEIVALIFMPLSDRLADPRPQRMPRHGEAGEKRLLRQAGNQDSRDIASFYIGHNWYGIQPTSVVAAVDAERLTPIPGSSNWIVGCLMYEDNAISVVNIAAAIQAIRPPHERRRWSDGFSDKQQILVLKSVRHKVLFGLIVDRLAEVTEIETHRIEPVPSMLSDSQSMIESLVKPCEEDHERRILMVLSAEKILERCSLAEPHAQIADQGAILGCV